MLVLTRKPNQSILIGDDIEIRVLQVRGDQVRLGIKAPPHISIFREEILQTTRKEGDHESAGGNGKDKKKRAEEESPSG